MKTTLYSLLATAALCAAAAFADAQSAPPATQAKVQSLSHLPLAFIENRGQLDPQVGYYANANNTAVYFTPQGITVAVIQPNTNAPAHRMGKGHLSVGNGSSHQRQRWILKLDFVGADASVRPMAQEPKPGVISYFKGSREQWKTGLKTYGKVVYTNLWPGIELQYSGNTGRLKYTFAVKPGVDPQQIRLGYRGATAVRINAVGQLEVSTSIGDLHDDKPTAYQEINGQRIPVTVSYAIDPPFNSNEGNPDSPVGYHFNLGTYDPRYALIIDPAVFVYAQLLGGDDYALERGLGIAVDDAGNAYVWWDPLESTCRHASLSIL